MEETSLKVDDTVCVSDVHTTSFPIYFVVIRTTGKLWLDYNLALAPGLDYCVRVLTRRLFGRLLAQLAALVDHP